MKIYMKHSMRRIFFLFYCLTVGFGAMNAFAQKDILLYSTDFTDWGASTTYPSNSGTSINGTLAGEGFVLLGKPGIFPAGVVTGAQLGYIDFNDGSGNMTFRPFDFVSGGALELELYVNKNTKTLNLTGVTVSSGVIDNQPAAPLPVSTISGATFISGKNYGIQKLTYYFSGTGFKTLKIAHDAKTEWKIASMKVYSTVGATPYVASTNYAKYPAAGHSLTGTVGGAKYSGTPSNAKIKVKGWNIGSADVQLALEGVDAARFSFSNTADVLTSTMLNADALAEKDVTIYYTPSVKKGVFNAKLKISAAGVASPYYVGLTGITGGSTPEIIADTATIPIYTSLITQKQYTLNLAGLNLTNDILLKVTGANANAFTLSQSKISSSLADDGVALGITYTGDIQVGMQNAVLEISSVGATTVKIPLKGYTYDSKPTLYKLDFDVSPSGTGYVNMSPQGTYFPEGTIVKVTATPETGYVLVSWQGSGSKKTVRTFTVGKNFNTNTGDPITVTFATTGGCSTPCECDPTLPECLSAGLMAYSPTLIDNVSIKAAWSAVVGATNYKVQLYDFNGTAVGAPVTVTTTDYTFTGLTAGTLYKYSVETTYIDPVTTLSVTQNSGIVGPFKTTGASSGFTCGQ